MSGYVHGQSQAASRVRELQQELVKLRRTIATAQREAEQQAAVTIAQANTTVCRIINGAIEAADRIRHDAEEAALATKATAEHEAARIRECAYLEGRVRADQQRIKHDHAMAGDGRRQQLERNLK